MAIIKKNMILDALITDPKHLVNKKYVEDLIKSKIVLPVNFASVDNVVGTYNATNKTFTATANGAITLDGIVGVLNDRVLLKDQTTATQNGIYVITTVGTAGTPFVLTRAIDFVEIIANNTMIDVIEGEVNGNTSWVVINQGTITIDTTALSFHHFKPVVEDVGGGGEPVTGTVKKYVKTVAGDGVQTTITVTHDLDTQDIVFSIIDDTFNIIYCGISSMTANTLVLSFDVPLENERTYKITVIG